MEDTKQSCRFLSALPMCSHADMPFYMWTVRFREVVLPKDPQVVPRVGCWLTFRTSAPPLASSPLSHQALSSIVRIQVPRPDTLWPKSPGQVSSPL